MRKVMMAGIGAVGAAIAAATGVYFSRDGGRIEPASLARSGAETVCIRSNIRLVEGMTKSCLTSAQYEALRDREVIGGDGRPIEVSLTRRKDDAATGAARTCAEYDAMADDGWYALTGADMRREEYFKRACGSLSLLVDAKPASTTHFSGGKADASDVRTLANTEATAFGETAPSANVDVSEVDEGVWKILIGQGETMVYEIAHADFTGDGVGEILAYVSTGVVDGTARSGAVGFLTKPSAGGPCAFTPH